MENETMKSKYSYRSSLKMNKGLRESLVKSEWLPSVGYLQNNVSLAWNKRNDDKPSLRSMGNQRETLMFQNCSSMEIYRSAINNVNSCKFNHPKSSTRYHK
jgi:hypothetical protein